MEGNMKLGFIGIGHMGGAMLRGMAGAEMVSHSEIYICGRDFAKTSAVAEETKVTALETIEELVGTSDIFFVGVKPGLFPQVLPQIAARMNSEKICVSMAAGVKISQIEEALGTDKKIVRIMPNTPVQLGEGMTSVSRNANVTDEEMNMVIGLFTPLGKAEEVSEDLIHTVIGVSGSSTAYTYMYIEALMDTAVKNGMDAEKARTFAAQAVLGAAKLALESDTPLGTLVSNACTPGGTTIEAVEVLKREGFEDIVARGFQAAVDKSKKMSGDK